MDPILQAIQQKWGVTFEGIRGISPRLQLDEKERGGRLAMDAQPELITISNSGIPAFLSTYIDPKIIEILVRPMKATEIVGEETKKGDWTLETAMFPVVESTGEVSSYGDYSQTGVANANVNWVSRQSYVYQVITQWGERELEKMGLARIDWANRMNIASVLTLNLFQNKSYFFGVNGLANYGLLNDPTLPAAITPLVYETVTTWANKAALSDGTGPLAILNDVRALYEQLVSQANGNIDLETDSPMTLAMSPGSEVYLTASTIYNMSAKNMIEKNFPRIKFKTAPEYATASGNLVQLIADEMLGQRTATTAFTEKLRAHPIIVKSSSFEQKKSQGTWGCIIFRPFLIAQMLGV
jgi:hypothetical protein